MMDEDAEGGKGEKDGEDGKGGEDEEDGRGKEEAKTEEELSVCCPTSSLSTPSKC